MKLARFSAVLFALSVQLYCQESNSQRPLTLSGYVNDCHANPVPETSVRLHEGGTASTTQSGEFTISNLPDKVKIGFPVTMYVEGWVVADPHMGGIGRFIMPSPDAEALSVEVGKRGDRCLITLARTEVILGLRVFNFGSSGANTNTGRLSADPESNSAVSESTRGPSWKRFKIASLSLNRASLQAGGADNGQFTPDRDWLAFLAARGEDLGFSLDDMRQAVEDWSREATSSYQKGLVALYHDDYDTAASLFHEANSTSDTNTQQMMAEAFAQFKRAHYTESTRLLQALITLHPQDDSFGRALTVVANSTPRPQPPGGVTGTAVPR